MEIAALVASLIAIGIGILAIWLSIVFYRMTSELSVSTKEAARHIGASVDRLETLFNRMYTDTFSMMRDTVTDMRKHIWPEKVEASEKISEEAEKRADEKVKVLKKGVDEEVTSLLEMQSKTDAKVESLKGQFDKLVDRIIAQSRKLEIEARQETLKEHIISEARLLKTRRPSFQAKDLVDRVQEKFPEIALRRILEEIKKLKHDGVLCWEGEAVLPDTMLELKA